MTREVMGRRLYADFPQSWEDRIWPMSAGFIQPAAHTDSVQNTSEPQIPNKRQPNALLALKEGGNIPPPPSVARRGQRQGRI